MIVFIDDKMRKTMEELSIEEAQRICVDLINKKENVIRKLAKRRRNEDGIF